MSEGGKAKGLRRLPTAWTPRFSVVPNQRLVAGQHELLDTAQQLIDELQLDHCIVRSNAADETLADRGRHESFVVNNATCETVAEALSDVAKGGQHAGVQMGAIVQHFVAPLLKGHLSNERRVSKTRNQWQVESETNGGLNDRFNSQRDPPADPSKPLPPLRAPDLRRALASIGRWATQTFQSRVHMEWVFDGTRLWIVQIDLEDEAPDPGVDPRVQPIPLKAIGAGRPKTPSRLLPAEPERFPSYRKIASIADFAAVCTGNYPRLYVICGSDLEAFIKTEGADTLRACIGERLVCRTDLLPEARSAAEGLNLPRTDTVQPEEIVEFMRIKAAEFASRGISNESYVFIIHHFLPATAGAWAEAEPNSRIVRVDALWGLPDGLQTLAHDSFEFDLRTDSVVAEHIAFKPNFLAEQVDGSWELRPVQRKLSRFAVLERADVAAIARGTARLAEQHHGSLRVMWFAGVASRPEEADVLPWFCMHPEEADVGEVALDRSHLRRLPRRTINGVDDLASPLPRAYRLVLEPSIEHIRDNKFLAALTEYAEAGEHIIELHGSVLSHTYYLLTKGRAPVVTPDQLRHQRVRRRQTFSKLVRDRIPDRIKAKGERVRALRLPEEERRLALLAKVIEEAQEIAASTAVDDLKMELADLLEVLRSLVRDADLSWEDVEAAADEKAEQVGSFDEGLVLVETNVPSNEAQSEVAVGTLANLSRPTALEEGVSVPIMALLEDPVEVTMGARTLRVALTEDQVRIEDVGPTSTRGQLSFDL